MNGKMQKLKDNLGDYLFPITVPEAIFVDKEKDLAKKLEELDANAGTYVIDLKRWGITEGIPQKPYTDSDFIKADSNMSAINRALEWAETNNYTQVILPKGEYAICYPRQILMRNNITFNGNGSRMKVIFNSDSKSPLDTRTGTDYHQLIGDVFVFGRRIRNAHLINLTLEGCKYDRSFTTTDERNVEGSYGVVFRESVYFCSVTHCKISGFMGDSINFINSGYVQSGTGTQVLGDLDSTGSVIPSTTSVVAGYISIPSGYDTFTIGNFGQSYLTTLNTKEADVAFYKEDNTFIGMFTRRRIWTPITIPVGATKLKLKFYDETDATKDFQLAIKFGNPPLYCEASYNEVFFGHRGGIQGGGSYTQIKNNIIRDNGLGISWIDGKATFGDPTRYAINQEDHFGCQTVVSGNVIIGGGHGVLIRTYYALIENNTFLHTSQAIILYPVEFTKITKNYFYRCGISINLFGSGYESSHVQIDGNSINHSELLLENTDYVVNCHDNHILNSRITLGEKATFKNNHIKITKRATYASNDTIIGGTVEGCKFYADKPLTGETFRLIFATVNRMIGCVFNEIEVYPNTTNTVFDNCTFVNGKITNSANTNTASTRTATFNNCSFTDFVLANVYSSGGESRAKIVVNKSELSTVDNTYLYLVNSNAAQTVEYVTSESKITIRNSSVTSLLSSQTGVSNTSTFTIKNSDIEYTGATPINVSYYPSSGAHIFQSILTGNKLKNISMATLSGAKFLSYNPETHSLTEPTSGYFPLGKNIPIGTPTAGGYMGWICLTEGWANSVVWDSTMAYTVGQQVNTGGNVYQCTVAGTSGTVSPTHTSGTATDGTVTWIYMGKKAVFKQYGTIQA